MEITDKPVSAPETTLRPLSLMGQINLNLFWLANNFHWQALLAVVIPSMVAHYLGDEFKAINLSAVVTLGTICAVIVNPLAGALSDYAKFRMGRRRPFMIIGTIFNVIVLVLFAFSPTWFARELLLVVFMTLFVMLQITNNLANSPWSAIIADKVPHHQRGLSSGFNGLFTLLGTAIGSIVAGIILGETLPLPLYSNAVVQIFLLIAIVQIAIVVYTVLTVKETPLSSTQDRSFQVSDFFKKFFFKPSRYPDLSWVLLARFLMMMGIYSVFYFLVYFFQDVLGGQGVKTILLSTTFTGEQFNGVLFQPAVMIAALPTSIFAGWASDHWGRKGLVYLSGTMMVAACILFIFFQNQYVALLAAIFFGVAYGAYTSVDWALTTDVLPPTDEAGKFMGIWSTMGILPQVVATLVGGIVLQALKPFPDHFNYTALFLLTALYMALGTLVIRQVRGVR